MPISISQKRQEDVIKLCNLLEYTYDVKLRQDQIIEIIQQILSGWTNADQSEMQLLDIVDQLYQNPPTKNELYDLFRICFSYPVTSDETRILATVHKVIEELQPGVTGVLLPQAPQSQSIQPQSSNYSSHKPLDYIGLSNSMLGIHQTTMSTFKW